jgi:aryl-alcohol dehydrogenase-like predicted oxidoreductase
MQTRTIGPVTASAIGLGGMPMSIEGGPTRVSPQRVTLAWMLAKAPVVIPIPGASRPESIIDSARAPELALTPGALARLDAS